MPFPGLCPRSVQGGSQSPVAMLEFENDRSQITQNSYDQGRRRGGGTGGDRPSCIFLRAGKGAEVPFWKIKSSHNV